MAVTLFHLPTCPQCRAVERMMEAKHIDYVSCTDIDAMTSKGVQHTPTLEVDGELLQGKAIFNWIKGVGETGSERSSAEA